jgi:predicted nicotinamide N-methyase
MRREQLFGYPIRRWQLTIGGRALEVVGPANQDDLLDDPEVQARFETDEYLPYWGQLWPAAVMLAEHILSDEPGQDRAALEIGCGLGLVAVAARLAGWDVLATDYDDAALEFVRENARLNHLVRLQVGLLDWRKPSTADRFDRIFASDVLYERRHHQPVAEIISQLLGTSGVALVSDPNRQTARGFDEALARADLAWETAATHATQPHGRYVEGTIYRIWRRP